MIIELYAHGGVVLLTVCACDYDICINSNAYFYKIITCYSQISQEFDCVRLLRNMFWNVNA